MATGREGRAARLNERLRGAGRANVGSDGFDLNIEGIDHPLASASSSSPSAKPSDGTRRSSELPSGTDQLYEAVRSPNTSRHLLSSPRRPFPFQEEITESPIYAPGSGRRRRVPVQEALASSARMNDAIQPEKIQPIALPSLEKSSRHIRAPTPPTPNSMGPHSDERLRDKSRSQGRHSKESMPPQRIHEATETRRKRDASESAATDEEAEEIGDKEAAYTIGQKRPRVTRQHSPQLGSEESDTEPPRGMPAGKLMRPTPRREPVMQRHPKKRNTAEGHPKKRGRPRKEAAAQQKSRLRVGSNDDAIIEITVQRFVNGDDAGSEEEAQSEIPFANRSSETVVDVLAQVCEEVIATTLGNYQHLLENTPHDAKKKDCRIKMRAIEAFREEVSAQLLQHSIYLNHWYSLRKRIRHVQKEKLELRQEILRLKAEREQLALRIDGVRGRSEKDGNDSKQRLNTSHTMHDIDLAVEQGRNEGDSSSRARKEAKLGNLELLISQLADQASNKGLSGGLLDQIRNFNVVLERAAAALDQRGN